MSTLPQILPTVIADGVGQSTGAVQSQDEPAGMAGMFETLMARALAPSPNESVALEKPGQKAVDSGSVMASRANPLLAPKPATPGKNLPKEAVEAGIVANKLPALPKVIPPSPKTSEKSAGRESEKDSSAENNRNAAAQFGMAVVNVSLEVLVNQMHTAAVAPVNPSDSGGPSQRPVRSFTPSSGTSTKAPVILAGMSQAKSIFIASKDSPNSLGSENPARTTASSISAAQNATPSTACSTVENSLEAEDQTIISTDAAADVSRTAFHEFEKANNQFVSSLQISPGTSQNEPAAHVSSAQDGAMSLAYPVSKGKDVSANEAILAASNQTPQAESNSAAQSAEAAAISAQSKEKVSVLQNGDNAGEGTDRAGGHSINSGSGQSQERISPSATSYLKAAPTGGSTNPVLVRSDGAGSTVIAPGQSRENLSGVAGKSAGAVDSVNQTMPGRANSSEETPAPSTDSDGTSIAKQDMTMRQAEKTNKIAGQTEKVLPGNGISVTRSNVPSPVGSHGMQFTATVAASSSTSANTNTAATLPVNLAVTPSAVDLHDGILERAQNLVALNTMRLSDSGNNSMQVVIKPAAGTQISLELRQHGGTVEVQAVLQQGDFNHLNQQWSDLQQRLDQRGIRLAPLVDNGSFAGNPGNETFQQKQGQTAEPVPDLPHFEAPAVTFAPARQPQVQTRTYPGWETWA